MIFANCEVYENEKGEIGVLTRTEYNRPETFLINGSNPNDVSINFDKRLIEFFLTHPNASYREWDKLLADCGYNVSIFGDQYPAAKDPEHRYHDEIMEHYDDLVEGFEATYVPKGMLVRISVETVRDEYGEYDGERQVVLVYSKEDFIET